MEDSDRVLGTIDLDGAGAVAASADGRYIYVGDTWNEQVKVVGVAVGAPLFVVTDTADPRKSVEDATEEDFSPTKNKLQVVQDAGGDASIDLTVFDLSEQQTGWQWKWAIETSLGEPASNWSATFGTLTPGAPQSVTWTNPGGTPNRQFRVAAWRDQGGTGDWDEGEPKRMLFVDVLENAPQCECKQPECAGEDSGLISVSALANGDAGQTITKTTSTVVFDTQVDSLELRRADLRVVLRGWPDEHRTLADPPVPRHGPVRGQRHRTLPGMLGFRADLAGDGGGGGAHPVAGQHRPDPGLEHGGEPA